MNNQIDSGREWIDICLSPETSEQSDSAIERFFGRRSSILTKHNFTANAVKWLLNALRVAPPSL